MFLRVHLEPGQEVVCSNIAIQRQLRQLTEIGNLRETHRRVTQVPIQSNSVVLGILGCIGGRMFQTTVPSRDIVQLG